MKSSEPVWRHPKHAFHALQDQETTLPPTGNKKKHFSKKIRILFFFRKMFPSAKKCKSGTPWDLLPYILLQNIKKIKGGPLMQSNSFRKKVS